MEILQQMHEIHGSLWVQKAEELYKVQKVRREMEKTEQIISNLLKKMSNYKNARGGHYKFTAVERRGIIDYTAITELRTIDLEPYRKESTIAWKLEMDLPVE